MSALRERLRDGNWHRAQLSELEAQHGTASVKARLMPLHVEVRGERARLADKSHCTFCEGLRQEILRLKARIAKLEGRAP